MKAFNYFTNNVRVILKYRLLFFGVYLRIQKIQMCHLSQADSMRSKP